MKKNILTSAVVSSLLVGALAFSGCGGSSNSSNNTELPTLSKDDTKAEGSAKIIAGTDGIVNQTIDLISEKEGVKVAKATVEQVLKDGEPACGAGEECTVIAKQISACQIDASSASFTNALSHVDDLISGAGDRYDPNKDMIVFGGTMQIQATGFNQASLDLDVNMISCGSAISKDNTPIQAGFSNEGHVVDVFVQTADDVISIKSEGEKKGFWIRNVRIKDGKIQLTSEMIEEEFKKVGGEGKCLDMPVTFTFYSIKDSNKDNTTGVTGTTGAE